MTTTRFLIAADANRRDGKLAAIHVDGCTAAKRDITRSTYVARVDGTLRDALDVAVDLEDRDLGYTDADAKVHACAT